MAASGSPVYRDDASVVGMVYMGITEIYFDDPADLQKHLVQGATHAHGTLTHKEISTSL